MTEAADFLRGWIRANVQCAPSGQAEFHAVAQELVEQCLLAAPKVGIDPGDPAMDPEWLYEQMRQALDRTWQMLPPCPEDWMPAPAVKEGSYASPA